MEGNDNELSAILRLIENTKKNFPKIISPGNMIR
jgi:hypothetical protein